MGTESTQPLRGFRDVLPAESERLTNLEAVARRTLARYGFCEIRLPTVENRALFEKSTGETSDIVEKEMFSVHTQNHNEFALRPEGTPGVVRAWLNNNLGSVNSASKFFYMGSMFRAERPQKGRYREFQQFGVESLGNPHPVADVEVILALNAVFEAVGLAGKTRLRINNIGCLDNENCRPAFRKVLHDFLSKQVHTLCNSCQIRLQKNPLRVLDCKGDGPRLKESMPPFSPCDPCRNHVDHVSTFLALNEMIHAVPDPHLVRGLDYYTRTVFEFSADGLGAQDALAGGGRYDALVESMGGPKTPAVGWGLGVDRLLMAIAASDPDLTALSTARNPCQVFVAVQTPEMSLVTEGTRILESLRRFKINADGGLFSSTLKAQLKEADRRGAPLCIIFGDRELADNRRMCILRNLKTSTQQEVSIDNVVEVVAGQLPRSSLSGAK